MNRDGQVNKVELFTLFKRVLMGDSSMYPNQPQQQYQYGGNQYPQYQGGNQNQYNQGGNPYQQYPGNNQGHQYQGMNNYPQNIQNPQNQGNIGNQFGYGNQNTQPNPYGNTNYQNSFQGNKGSNQQTGPRYYWNSMIIILCLYYVSIKTKTNINSVQKSSKSLQPEIQKLCIIITKKTSKFYSFPHSSSSLYKSCLFCFLMGMFCLTSSQ